MVGNGKFCDWARKCVHTANKKNSVYPGRKSREKRKNAFFWRIEAPKVYPLAWAFAVHKKRWIGGRICLPKKEQEKEV